MNEKTDRPRRSYKPDGKLWYHLKPLAREMRHEPTHAELVMWEHLRARRMVGVKFRRQHAIDEYIVDFCAVQLRLVIEIDGGYHKINPEHDKIRQHDIEYLGFTVLRFTNEEVFHELTDVLTTIRNTIIELSA